jgi:hypothetical protein
MRLWSLHPAYLDGRGLVALWREALLAQAVLRGQTRGYKHHPQLQRFRANSRPVGTIADYLRAVRAEACRRGYRFAADRISRARGGGHIAVSRGQLDYEWQHLVAKLRRRDPQWLERFGRIDAVRPHPLFRVTRGGIADWEKI